MPCASSAELGERRLRVVAQLGEQLLDRLGIIGDELAGEPDLHGHGDEMLLRTVVEVALDLAAGGIGRGDDAGTRRLQVGVGLPQLLEAGLQRGVELAVVDRRRRPAG